MPIEKKELGLYNKISYDIIGCAYKVHHALGPGLLESAYRACMVYEITKLGYNIKVEKPSPLFMKM